MNQLNEDIVDLREVFAILRRQLRLIVMTVVIVLALAFVFVIRTTPQYTAMALIRVNPQETNLLNPTVAAAANSNVETTQIETEVEILKSSRLALKTIETAKLHKSEEFGRSVGLFDKFRAVLGMELPPPPTGQALLNESLKKFDDALTVRRRGLTYLVGVQVTSTDPEQSANIANTHALTYIDAQVSSRIETSNNASKLLREERDKASQRLARSNESLRRYVADNIDRLSEEVGTEQLAALKGKLGNVTGRLGELRQSLDAANTAVAQQNWSMLADRISDQALVTLEQERQGLLQQLQGTGADSTTRVDLDRALADLDKRLQDRARTAVSDLKQDVQQVTTVEAGILDEIQEAMAGRDLSSRTVTEIYGLNRDAIAAQQLYDNVISRLRDLEAQAVVQIADSRMISEALVPSQPSYPNKTLVLAMALTLASVLGVGLALLKEFYYGGVTSANQLGNIVPVKVGAVVPKLSYQQGRDTLADKVSKEPMTQFAEAFRKLRASVDQALRDRTGGAVVLVTSAIPAEGKSTTALSLARTYALAGKRTLLIDADLRNPSIHQFIREEPGMGLLEYLQAGQPTAADPDAKGTDPAEEFYVLDPLSSLGIILGSRRANVPTDAPLQSDAFRDLVANARNAFDVVVIDSAPLIPVVDTQYIAPLVDAAVICVRFGEASQVELRTAYAQLRDTLPVEADVLSVLNCFEGGVQSYRYDGYYGG